MEMDENIVFDEEAQRNINILPRDKPNSSVAHQEAFAARDLLIEQEINSFRIEHSRKLLSDALKEPTARTHYLASLVSVDERQRDWQLARACALDPIYNNVATKLTTDTKDSELPQKPLDRKKTVTLIANYDGDIDYPKIGAILSIISLVSWPLVPCGIPISIAGIVFCIIGLNIRATRLYSYVCLLLSCLTLAVSVAILTMFFIGSTRLFG